MTNKKLRLIVLVIFFQNEIHVYFLLKKMCLIRRFHKFNLKIKTEAQYLIKYFEKINIILEIKSEKLSNYYIGFVVIIIF